MERGAHPSLRSPALTRSAAHPRRFQPGPLPPNTYPARGGSARHARGPIPPSVPAPASSGGLDASPPSLPLTSSTRASQVNIKHGQRNRKREGPGARNRVSVRATHLRRANLLYKLLTLFSAFASSQMGTSSSIPRRKCGRSRRACWLWALARVRLLACVGGGILLTPASMQRETKRRWRIAFDWPPPGWPGFAKRR